MTDYNAPEWQAKNNGINKPPQEIDYNASEWQAKNNGMNNTPQGIDYNHPYFRTSNNGVNTPPPGWSIDHNAQRDNNGQQYNYAGPYGYPINQPKDWTSKSFSSKSPNEKHDNKSKTCDLL
jgi:hypothetical protein